MASKRRVEAAFSSRAAQKPGKRDPESTPLQRVPVPTAWENAALGARAHLNVTRAIGFFFSPMLKNPL